MPPDAATLGRRRCAPPPARPPAQVNADINMWVLDENSTGGWYLYPKGCESQGGCGHPSDPFGDAFSTVGLQVGAP